MKIKRISFFERVQGLEEDNFDVKTLSSISINVLTLLSGSHCSLGAEVTTCFSTKKKLETRSRWLNCALRDVYCVSIGHYEAVEVGN